MSQGKSIWKSILWALLILIFPVGSGILSAVLGLGTNQTLFVQGAAMVLSLVPALSRRRLGFTGRGICRLWPVLVIFLPVAVKGFLFGPYVWGNLFLYAAVGLAEEVYFRGIIPEILEKAFSKKGVLWLSSVIFAVGHGAGALSGAGLGETLLVILNAFIFGLLAMEMVMLAGNLLPAVLVHFFFDFETKIVPLTGPQLLRAEVIRGFLMALIAVYFGCLLKKESLKP